MIHEPDEHPNRLQFNDLVYRGPLPTIKPASEDPVHPVRRGGVSEWYREERERFEKLGQHLQQPVDTAPPYEVVRRKVRERWPKLHLRDLSADNEAWDMTWECEGREEWLLLSGVNKTGAIVAAVWTPRSDGRRVQWRCSEPCTWPRDQEAPDIIKRAVAMVLGEAK